MNRRRALAALAGSGLTGGGLWVARNGLPGTASADGGRLPRRVETLDARGSSAGEAVVPTPGAVTVVDLFATWCGPCDEQVEILAGVRPEYDGVSFVSVTNERVGGTLTRDDIAGWWNRNGGAWTVGLDPGSELLAAFGAPGMPYVAITDEDGRVVYDHGGLVGADVLRTQLDDLT